ncbi:MAG: hypothetical protein MAG715_01362 [Methanonatronarchaeales archaeon]|nr:hypothetical protein [Methanonatronarchaeales archaeon]
MSELPTGRGMLPLRRKTARGFKPHFAARFLHDGSRLTLGFDTSRCGECDHFLITHAHSDHAGRSAMLSERSVASVETARALELLTGRSYSGVTFRVRDTLGLGVEVDTYDTGHTVGSTAFSWENDSGVRFLVTGDVKDYSDLPGCDVLLPEATYGDPSNPSHVFEDEDERLAEVVGDAENLFLGAYTFGKAQRAADLVREFGYTGPIGMDGGARRVTEELMDVGPFCEPGEASVNIVSPWSMGAGNNFVLSGREEYSRRIGISDHLDREGLLDMVEHCGPELVLPYHPDDRDACLRFSGYVEAELGVEAAPLHDRAETVVL